MEDGTIGRLSRLNLKTKKVYVLGLGLPSFNYNYIRLSLNRNLYKMDSSVKRKP